jgi:hypothetical protein
MWMAGEIEYLQLLRIFFIDVRECSGVQVWISMARAMEYLRLLRIQSVCGLVKNLLVNRTKCSIGGEKK